MNLPTVTLDLDALRLNLLRQKQPARVHIFEHGIADAPPRHRPAAVVVFRNNIIKPTTMKPTTEPQPLVR